MTDDPEREQQPESSELPKEAPVPSTDSPEGEPADAPSAQSKEQSGDLAAAQRERRSGQTAAAASDAPSQLVSAPLEAAPAEADTPAPAPRAAAPAQPRSAQDEAADAAAQNASVFAASRRHTRRSFVVAAAASAGGYMAYQWLAKRPAEGMQPSVYRRAFEMNAALSRGLFQERALAPTYPLRRAEELRVNGVYGLKRMLDPASYRLQLVGMRNATAHPRYVSDVTAWEYRYRDAKNNEDQGHDTKTPPASSGTAEKMAPAAMVEREKQREQHTGRMPRGREEAGQSHSTLAPGTPGLLLTMEDLLKLPRHELVTQFKCIEGWSQVVHWAGVRMADFLEAYPPAQVDGREPRYVYMETPDGDYYVGHDIDVCRHPQTLLVTEMMGAPLTQFHGAPLRLHMPTRYGYKQIKRIGLIHYTNSKPDDYWTKLGYDWYAGL